MRQLIILGNCGNGGDIITLVESLKAVGEALIILGYLDDQGPKRGCLRQLPWLGRLCDASSWPSAHFALAIGSEHTYHFREHIYKTTGLTVDHLAILTHPHAQVSPEAYLEPGVIVQYGCFIGDNVRISIGSYLSPMVFVGHDSHIGAWSVVAPGAIICGKTKIEDHVYIGAGSRIRPGIRIGTGALIGMGAVVTKNVPPWTVVVGNPARILRHIKSESRTIKAKA